MIGRVCWFVSWLFNIRPLTGGQWSLLVRRAYQGHVNAMHIVTTAAWWRLQSMTAFFQLLSYKSLLQYSKIFRCTEKIWWMAHAAVGNDFDVVAKCTEFVVNIATSVCHCWLPQVFNIRWHEAWLMEENTEQFNSVAMHVTQQSEQSAHHTYSYMQDMSSSLSKLHVQELTSAAVFSPWCSILQNTKSN